MINERIFILKTLYKLEAKFGKYAIKNLSVYMAACFLISYLLELLAPSVYAALVFSPVHVFVSHQFWRLFTWIFTTPGSINIFSFIMIFFYFSIGTSIERGIGTFWYNLYVFGGLILITLGQLFTWLILYLVKGKFGFLTYAIALDGAGGASMMTYYMTVSVFLGYALLYQDAMVLLYFVIPFKVKWMAYIDGVFLVYYFFALDGITSRVTILAIGINFLVYYLTIRGAARGRKTDTWQSKQRRTKRDTRRSKAESKVVEFGTGKPIPTPSTITRHKCAVCGRTENDGIELEFRFCSKCNGNYEYCQDHLYTHTHVE
jgi:hypothetical protein